jgi:ammonium transporter, Amt family
MQDFAASTVVHYQGALAALAGALLLGPRIGKFGHDGRANPIPGHNMPYAVLGTLILWFGWFGFNAGSNLEASGGALIATLNTFVATAAAALAWLFVEWGSKGKASLLGALSGAIAGLVAVTPASGYAGPMGALVLGLIAGGVCFVFCTTVKNAAGYDDSLDVFGVHCIGGIIGAILTGILVNPKLGGTGIVDYADGGKIAEYALATQLWAQIKAVVITLVWSGVGSAILFKIVDLLVGLRVPLEQEREGLDLTAHGERAYTG